MTLDPNDPRTDEEISGGDSAEVMFLAERSVGDHESANFWAERLRMKQVCDEPNCLHLYAQHGKNGCSCGCPLREGDLLPMTLQQKAWFDANRYKGRR